MRISSIGVMISARAELPACGSSSIAITLAPAPAPTPTPTPTQQSVIMFLGDGYGMVRMTATRIYAVGEDGELSIE